MEGPVRASTPSGMGAGAPRSLGRALGPLGAPAFLVALSALCWMVAARAMHDNGLRGPLGDAAIALASASLLALLGVPASFRRARWQRSGIVGVDAMPGPEFERRLAELFGAMGYGVEETGRSGDFGADLVVERGATRVVVQAKRYDRPVGIAAVQQAIGATRHYGADTAMVVTSSTCTPAARALASSNGVRLVERDELVALLATHPGPTRTGPGPVVRQFADGAVVVAFVLGLLLRLGWWVLRLPVRVLR